jgi:hypothetical protein
LVDGVSIISGINWITILISLALFFNDPKAIGGETVFTQLYFIISKELIQMIYLITVLRIILDVSKVSKYNLNNIINFL